MHKLSDFIAQLHEAKKATFGICFGHQLMAQVLGGTVEWKLSNKGWELGISHNQVVAHEEYMQPQAKTIDVIFSIQGHPEFNTTIVEGILSAPSYDDRPAILAQGMANSAGIPDTGLLFQWIVNFYRRL